MKEFWNFIQMVFMAVGGWLGWFMGGCDGLLYALIAFVVIDYLTGVMCAFADHTLSSEVGFRGICRKVLIFFTGRNGKHSGCVGDREWICAEDSSDLFSIFPMRV